MLVLRRCCAAEGALRLVCDLFCAASDLYPAPIAYGSDTLWLCPEANDVRSASVFVARTGPEVGVVGGRPKLEHAMWVACWDGPLEALGFFTSVGELDLLGVARMGAFL